MQSAGKLARIVLDSEPETLLIWERSCDLKTVEPAFHATLAALQAAAFRFATFKSKPKARTALAGIDLAPPRKLSDLDATLATSAGNNIARWLTALPPNTLNAAAYRRLLQDLARRLKLSYRFYGEPELKRLGAGAFLAVSQGNATRDAGIVRLAYRPRGAAVASGALLLVRGIARGFSVPALTAEVRRVRASG